MSLWKYPNTLNLCLNLTFRDPDVNADCSWQLGEVCLCVSSSNLSLTLQMLPPAHTATSGCPPVFVDGPQFLSLGFGCVHVFTVIYPSVLFSLVAYVLCLLTDPFFSFVLVSVSFWPFNDILSSLPVELLSSSLVWAFGLWPSPHVLCSSSLSDSFFQISTFLFSIEVIP